MIQSSLNLRINPSFRASEQGIATLVSMCTLFNDVGINAFTWSVERRLVLKRRHHAAPGVQELSATVEDEALFHFFCHS